MFVTGSRLAARGVLLGDRWLLAACCLFGLDGGAKGVGWLSFVRALTSLVSCSAPPQVCNLADCIKVACDFVSPENIERCEILTREFREQNQSMAWKEDVLQLRTMMWFAWLSCARQEKEMEG